MDRQLQPRREARDSRHVSPLLKLALLLGILVHLSGFFVFRVISSPLPSSEESAAFISLVPMGPESHEAELIEQASLFDSAPLFIPGEWNSASKILPAGIFEEWQAFPDFEPRLELMDEVGPDRGSLSQVAGVNQPSDLLALRFWDLLSYFGQGEREVAARQTWGSLARVRVLKGSEENVPSREYRLQADLAAEEYAPYPVVFVLNMHAAGLPMGAPLLRQSSGSDSLDAKALEWLERPDTMARLPAGLLEIRIFP